MQAEVATTVASEVSTQALNNPLPHRAHPRSSQVTNGIRHGSIDSGLQKLSSPLYPSTDRTENAEKDDLSDDDKEDQKADISNSHRVLVTMFEKYTRLRRLDPLESKDKLVEEFISTIRKEKAQMSPQDCHLDNLHRQGEEDATILSFMLKSPQRFQNRVPLFRWVMTEYPELYRVGVVEKKSILHLAADKCQSSPKQEYLSSLIKMYPSQLADLLTDAPDQGLLLSRIMPFIRFSAGEEFLKFFGQLIEQTAAHVVLYTPFHGLLRFLRQTC